MTLRRPPWQLGRVLSGCLGAAVLGAACGTSPTAPVQSPPAVLIVSGTIVLTGIGQTTQFSVTSSTGAVVTSGLAWQTSAAGVATVSATGLVTATGFGTTNITATAAGATGGLTVSVVQTGTGTTTVGACQAITAPGAYVLNSDLTPVGPDACLNIVSVVAVQLDCRGHLVPGIFLSKANTITVSNCTVTSWPASPNALEMTNVNTVSMTGSTIDGLVVVGGGMNVTLQQDSIVTTVHDAYVVFLQNGLNNHLLQLTTSGGYDGSAADVGADDGILLENETGDTIHGNMISSVFDAGIEGVDAVTNTNISGNTITNVGYTGIGTYWCTAWSNNVIQANTVSQAPMMFDAIYETDPKKCGPGGPAAAFAGNSIIGNRFRNQVQGRLGYTPPGLTAFFAVGTPVSGNLLQGNDFGPIGCATVSPSQGFMDGGGNVCLSPSLASGNR